MNTGQKIRIKSTQEIGTITEINGNFVKVYIVKRGTFTYAKSNLEYLDRVPTSDCIENSH
jgi:hypothetical protein